MEERPKIIVKLSRADKTLELLCLILLAILWTGTIAGFSELPDQIPSHFNAAGRADNYSGKTGIFTLPVVATIIYLGMTIINRYPHIFNFPATVTQTNARSLYTSATRLLRILKLAVIVIFSCIVLLTFKSVFGKNPGLGPWFLPVVLAVMTLPTIGYLLISSYPKKLDK